jgi:hypothetical protein
MIFDILRRLRGYVGCSVVRDLIIERWQTIFYYPQYHNNFRTLCNIRQSKYTVFKNLGQIDKNGFSR